MISEAAREIQGGPASLPLYGNGRSSRWDGSLSAGLSCNHTILLTRVVMSFTGIPLLCQLAWLAIYTLTHVHTHTYTSSEAPDNSMSHYKPAYLEANC